MCSSSGAGMGMFVVMFNRMKQYNNADSHFRLDLRACL